MQLLAAIALECDCAVIMPGHVSVAGMATNAGTSGSVQWSNACRSRLFLSRIVDAKEKEELDTDARLLEVRKANLGADQPSELELRWSRGVFVEDAHHVMWMPGQVQAAVEAEKEFMRMLDLTVDKVGLLSDREQLAP